MQFLIVWLCIILQQDAELFADSCKAGVRVRNKPNNAILLLKATSLLQET